MLKTWNSPVYVYSTAEKREREGKEKKKAVPVTAILSISL